MSNEAFARVKIDALLAAQGWDTVDTNAVRFEVQLPDGTRADYVLCDRHGRSLAVIEAKRYSVSPNDAAAQAKAYALQLGVPYAFLSNGDEVLFWEWEREAYPRPVKTIFKQDDLERRIATLSVRRDPATVAIDRHIVERDYQIECIDTLCREIGLGRRKLLVEMATGTGKTRTAAAFIKRLFEANAITRVLFLVDRIPLAKQTEDAFAEHLPDYPAYVLRAGRRFQDEKRITITTLQSMVNLYAEYSSGYFDLVISDECHRSIYGQWSGVLRHFDGVQVGLTATPCVADPDSGDADDKAFVRDTLRFFEVDAPTFSYKLKTAIRDGHLVPYQIYKAQTVKTAAEGGFEVKKAELDWSGMTADTRTELEKVFGEQAAITVDPSALERRFTIPERNRAIVREYRQVLDHGYVDGNGVLRKPLLGKAIVFAVTKKHAETLAQLFDAEFAHLKPSPDVRFADYVVSGQGADDTVDGMSKIRRFKKEQFPQILVSVNMLDTGFDCPEVVSLVFARFTRSAILYQQMRGRGTRKARNKPTFTMFDFVGVSDYHGDDDDYAQGGIVAAKQARKKYEPRRLLALDIDDHIDPTTREWITVDEDGNMVFPEASEQLAAELGTRFEAWLLQRTDLDAGEESWLRMIGHQFRANADHYGGPDAEFSLDQFAFHPFSQLGGMAQAIRVFGSQKRLAEVIGSLNEHMFAWQSDGADEGAARSGDSPHSASH
ncbi:MAG: DEAD/DEAH box helicase family protein [Rhodocyclaceae bacterium]|nr:DEAD/DEAH box helicase family protein [Rhodocyclaceae bacterium]MCA3074186.1 DEAD/DEAH box helicase family protein [Rhodocyclaceae bacterium]MCA3095093.1 DEAD/DEAH box helicase family protein [Rhodocyclaceae bacterium]MCA3099436.1 DEAD/DEAH box helicase family protein [Rhodocyclaceae bacterium]MCA3102823.1 DEAD/DEAH box helicase family protein [Rhodocyclaceae bacterium]